jgi:ATP-dependent Clp protease ATP-binding subunit ClpC
MIGFAEEALDGRLLAQQRNDDIAVGSRLLRMHDHEIAFEDAAPSGSNHIDTAHLLVGVLTDGYGVASDTLVGLGAALEEVRPKIAAVIGGGSSGEERD